MKKIELIISIILTVLVIIFLGYLRIKNMDMTNVRFVFEFWKEYIISFAILTVSWALFRQSFK